MKLHQHALSLGGTSPGQFTLTHEHDDGDAEHWHDVTPDGKTATSTTFVDVSPGLRMVRESEGNVARNPGLPDGQFDYAQLRPLVDDCVRALNNLVIAHTKDGLDMPVSLWASISQADLLVNQVQDAIPLRTIVRYPAWIDVYVESRGDEHRMAKTAALAQLGDAGAFLPNAQPYVLACEDQDVADGALRASRDSVWPDPKLEG